MEFLKNKFRSYDKIIGLDTINQEKIIFWLNAVEERRIDHNDFQNLLDTTKKVNWFSVYLVYDRVPYEQAN